MQDLEQLTEMLEYQYSEREAKKSKVASLEMQKKRMLEGAIEAENAMNSLINRIRQHDEFGDEERLHFDEDTGVVSIVEAE